MKKSNILLLAGFLAIVFFISAIHITLYAKYKAGDYTVYNEEDHLSAELMQTFPNILFVSVRNVPVATIKFSDVAQVEKDKEKELQYVRMGDTLVISARDSANQEDIGHQVVYLPRNATLSVFNSFLSFESGSKSVPNNPVIYLSRSHVVFSGAKNPLRLGHLKVIATDSSNVVFKGNTLIGQLDVELSQSSIDYRGGDLVQLSIVADSLSHLSFPTKHLVKGNIKTISPQ